MIKGHALVDLNPEKEIFQLGFEVFQIFIIQDDQKVLNKILYDIEKFNKKDNKFTVITLRFSMK